MPPSALTEAPTTHTDPPSWKSETAFPRLTSEEIRELACLAICEEKTDGQIVFSAGQPDMDLFVVEEGALEVINPAANNASIVTHHAGEFSGDVDLLTRRPILVTGIARGPRTRLLRVPGARLREVLNRVPRLGEKLIIAFQARRALLEDCGMELGLRVVGPATCRDTTIVREFLHKNFVPFSWHDSVSPRGKELIASWGSPKRSPVIELGGGKLLIEPSLRELARGAGVWRECPDRQVDLVVIGAGPAGLAAAVYAASEGLDTIVLDRLGPGGQAGGSSKIENFIGFPAGLSGTELATRGVLQMLKFGAKLAAPVDVEELIPSAEPGGLNSLRLDCGATIRAKTILVATGVRWRKLEAEGAARFERAGIYYACTSVEALLHDKQDVAVVGAGNSAGQAVMFLSECCRDRRVHHLIRGKLGPGMSQYMVSRIRSAPNVIVHEGVEVCRVTGERRVQSVTLRQSEKAATSGDGQPRPTALEELAVGAVFVFIGADPGAEWLPKSVARDSLGYLLTGVDAVKSGHWPLTSREPCPLETTLPGVMAAGDVRSGSTKRVGFAVGDGSLAVTCAHRLRSL